MKKIFCSLSLLFVLLLLFPPSVSAARKRLPKNRSPQRAVAAPTQGVKAQVRFRADRRALLINFSGFDLLDSGSYELTYKANGIPQGAGGSIILGDTSTKTILFGTCSGGVCNYHQNITDSQLKIISILKSGIKVIKPYRIRV